MWRGDPPPQLNFSTLLLSVKELRVVQAKTAEQITQESKKAIRTIGEWELLDITSLHPAPVLTDPVYIDKIIFSVG